jgi:hypothetical protein
VTFSKNQYIYCFTNTSFNAKTEGYTRVKIGKTDNILRRLKELFTTGLPEPFKVYRVLVVPNMDNMEKHIHKLLNQYRVNPKREFFDIPLSKIDDLFDLLLDFSEVEEYVEDGEEEEFEFKRSNFTKTLKSIGCCEGEILKYNGVSCKVVNSEENLIDHDGSPKSLSAAATDIAPNGDSKSNRRNGWDCFSWKDKKLNSFF